MRLRFVLAVFLVLFIVTCQCSSLISHASPASTHGCAPLNPPPVPGSPLPAPAIHGKLLINEVLSLPGSRWNCSEPQNSYSITSDSWVELYNPQSQPYNLYTAHATIKTGSGTTPFYLPIGSVIAPHGYLVLFPSMFSGTLLSANVRLLIGGVTIDQVNIPSLPIDQSYARIPDGSNVWKITNTPTVDSSNNMSRPGPLVSPTVPSSSQDPAGSGYATSTAAPIIGTQIVWRSLQFPTPVVETPVTKPTHAYTSALSSTANDGGNTPHRIMITILVVALALMLFWCWRLFTNS